MALTQSRKEREDGGKRVAGMPTNDIHRYRSGRERLNFFSLRLSVFA
ncbi:hypothetical protein [Desulfosarcina variabilis]